MPNRADIVQDRRLADGHRVWNSAVVGSVRTGALESGPRARRVPGARTGARGVERRYGPQLASLGRIAYGLDAIITEATGLAAEVARFLEDGLVVNAAYFSNRAGRSFSTSSDLADFLILEEQLMPGEAEQIAALTISRARDQGLEAAGITVDLIDGAAMMVIGRELKVEFEAISRYLAPRRFVERRTALGSPSPDSMRTFVAHRRQDHNERNERMDKRAGSRSGRGSRTSRDSPRSHVELAIRKGNGYPSAHSQTETTPESALLVAVDAHGSTWEITDSLEELARLVESVDAEVVGSVTQRLNSPVSATYLGKGKIEEIKDAQGVARLRRCRGQR